MDQQSLELGFWGILKTTARIFRTNLKHFLCISAVPFLLFALDLAIVPFPFDQAIMAEIINWLLPASGLPFGRLVDPGSLLLVPAASFLTLSLFTTVVITPAFSIGICRGFLDKTLHLKTSLHVIPKACVGILITYLCLIATIAVSIILLLLLTSVPFCILPFLKIDTLRPLLILEFTGFVGMFYLLLVWSLAFTVTILEEQWGWEALRRSAYLINGHKEVAVGLQILYLWCSILIPIPTFGKETSAFSRFAIIAVAAALSTLISLFNTGTTVVLYLSCKLHHYEPVKKLSAVTHYSDEELFSPSKYTNLNAHVNDMANV